MIEAFLPQGSTYAGHIDLLVNVILWIVGVWFIISEVVFFWLIFKFRARDGVEGQYITGEEKSQKRWITVPHALVLICDIFLVVGAIWVWVEIKQDLPPAEAEVRIISQQWAWTFVHEGPDGQLDTADDIRTINELHVQADTLYHFKLESKDVLHDFSVPVWRLKQDAIPGRVITGWFEPTLEGEFDIQCAEICGVGHALMGGRVHVESEADHAAWVADNSSTSLASAALPTAGGN
ncbi:MAG: cytochrome C oxidase subunit II [Myxococcota bacterium]|nr:cytochrome C oxidase subunit II [Myxococcota bacterium]